MSMFNRGLDDASFVHALNQEYDKGGWWTGFANDQDVFLAIPENYVNVYYRGCSLLRLKWKAGVIIGEIHYKYLLNPSISNPYVKIVHEQIKLTDDMKSLFLNSLNNISDLKKAAEPYAGTEKKGVHDILASNPNILDVEIAFGNAGSDESGPSAPRMDFAAIQHSGENVRIVFFEARRFDNKALRASGNAKPDVVRQIEIYSRKLNENRDAVIESYRRVCGNLRSLRGVAQRHPDRHAMLEGIEDGSRTLLVDENPVLIVFGFDEDQKNGDKWRPHRKKLKTLLDGRVHLKGDSKGFARYFSVIRYFSSSVCTGGRSTLYPMALAMAPAA